MTVTANLYCNLVAWASGTKAAGNYVSASGNAYRCTAGGTSATTPSGTSKAPISFGADTSQWVWLSAITFSGATANAAFSAASVGSTAVGGLAGSIIQPIVWWLWFTGAAWQVSAAGTPFLSLTGHAFTTTNTLTITPAPGQSFRDHGAGSPLAFNAANGVAFLLPNATGTQNYFNISDPNVTFDGLQFQDPDATSGSSIFNLNTGANNFHLRNCILDGTTQSGGAIMFGINSTAVSGLLFTNVLFVDRQPTNTNINTIQDIVTSSTTAAFVNCTFIFINPQNAGVAIVCKSSIANGWVIRNCISINAANGIIAETSTGSVVIDHCGTDATKVCNVAGIGTDGGGELVSQTIANMFVSATADSRTKQGSPFIDTGTPDVTNIPTADDIFRTPRPQSKAWDIGAYEYPAISVASLRPPSLQIWDH